MKSISLILSLAIAVLLLNLASAVTVDFVETTPLAPGEEGTLRIGIENNLNDLAEDISISLNFRDIPFIPVGTSEYSLNELEEDDDESFLFRIKASFDATPGDYKIPYTLTYRTERSEEPITREGTIGVRVVADPELSYSIETATPVIGRQGQITLKMVNKGFSSARFVSVQVFPEGFTLLSDDEAYIGEVDSDDFETTTFDAKFNKESARFYATIEYRNFDNELVRETINLPITVYTEEKAIELGIIQKNNTSSYIIGAVVLIILFFVWRSFKKRRRMKRSRQNSESK